MLEMFDNFDNYSMESFHSIANYPYKAWSPFCAFMYCWNLIDDLKFFSNLFEM